MPFTGYNLVVGGEELGTCWRDVQVLHAKKLRRTRDFSKLFVRLLGDDLVLDLVVGGLGQDLLG